MATVFLVSGAVAFQLSQGRPEAGVARTTVGGPSTFEAGGPGSYPGATIGPPQVAQALRALAQAQALPPAPSVDAIPRTMTPYQKLRFRHRSVDNLHQSLIVRVAAGTRQQCSSVNESPLQMKVVWKARMRPEGAVLSDPVLSMKDGGGVPEEVHDCFMKVLGPELSLDSQVGRPLPAYEGDVELGMNVGTEGDWRPPVVVP